MTSTTGLIMPKEKKIVGLNPAEKKEEKKSDLNKVPKPTGWRLTVLPYKGVGKTQEDIRKTQRHVYSGRF